MLSILRLTLNQLNCTIDFGKTCCSDRAFRALLYLLEICSNFTQYLRVKSWFSNGLCRWWGWLAIHFTSYSILWGILYSHWLLWRHTWSLSLFLVITLSKENLSCALDVEDIGLKVFGAVNIFFEELVLFGDKLLDIEELSDCLWV